MFKWLFRKKPLINMDWNSPRCMNCNHVWYFHELENDGSLHECDNSKGYFEKAKKLHQCQKKCLFYLHPNTVQGE
jgi:hypothetical protein